MQEQEPTTTLVQDRAPNPPRHSTARTPLPGRGSGRRKASPTANSRSRMLTSRPRRPRAHHGATLQA
jgi:hypothetical protein